MADKKDDFAKKLSQLEEIVDWFETSDIDISEGLKKFEKGSKLAEELKSQLDDIEVKVKKIQKSFE